MNRKRIFILFLFAIFFFSLTSNFWGKVEAQEQLKTALFRPIYKGYGRGTVQLMPVSENTSIIDRELNLEGWNITQVWDFETGTWVSSLAIHVIHCAPEWWFWIGGNLYYPPPLRMYISIDEGLTFPYYIDFPRHIIVMDKRWSPYNETTYWLCAEVVDFIPIDKLHLFGPTTRIKLSYIQTYPLEPPIYIGNYYWGPTQKPVPPYDYIDSYGSYVQYAVWFTVEYTELPISYAGPTISFPFPETKRRLNDAANMILNTMFDSGASNEVVGKEFGTDSWIVIYSSQLAMMELIDLCQIFPENASTYLRAVKRFITWMSSKQNPDGSFPFILTDGDLHPWYDNATNSWYGYDKIDSFSACAISLLRKYYNATHDLDFINKYWNNIFRAKEFIVSLMNYTYWLPVDGYHYNGTHYIKSDMNWLHDCVEVYQGIKDYAYLEGVRGNSSEQTYWNNYAESVANGIRTYFWNETLGRYVGIFNVTTGEQNIAKVYNIVTPVIYGIETNVTRASFTVSKYIDWGILSGRYYEVKWAEDYSVFNEYSTMSGMIYSAFAKLINLGYVDTWMKTKFIEVSKFLFNNPVYPNRDLQNADGFLDWVNLVNYTWAKEYARLIETSAWFIDGFMQIPNMTPLYNFTGNELVLLNQSLSIEAIYWENEKEEFHHETGYLWNETGRDGYDAWVQWLKDRNLYVKWYDFEFMRFLLQNEYIGNNPWWEEWDSDKWEYQIYYSYQLWMPVMLIFGLSGIGMLVIAPVYFISKIKSRDWSDAFCWGFLMFVIGVALIITWLWS